MLFTKILPRMSTCCCSVDLRFGLVVWVILESYAVGWFILSSSFNTPEVWMKKYKLDEGFVEANAEWLEILFYSLIALSVFKFVLNFLLLDGILLDRTVLIKLYVIGGIILCLLMTGASVVTYFVSPYKTIELLIQLVMTLYTLLLSNSYLDRILTSAKEKQKEQDATMLGVV